MFNLLEFWLNQVLQSNTKFLIHPTKGKVGSIDDMIEMASDFYKNLYKKQQIDRNLWNSLFDGIPTLNDRDKDKLDDDLSYEEVYKAVSGMPKRRAPGEDGLTVEVWKVVFPMHMNQTYCVPGRMINDNIHLIRSLIEDQKRLRDPIGIILWDYEKAFDKVEHEYLLAVLQAFGVGDSFISWISLLYSNSSFKIRLNNSFIKSK